MRTVPNSDTGPEATQYTTVNGDVNNAVNDVTNGEESEVER